MTTEEYRAHPALNFSLAKNLLKSPAHFQAALTETREPTSAMHIGTIAHAMILEGKVLADLCAIRPHGMSFVSKEGKAWKAEQTLPIISEDEESDLNLMTQAVRQNVYARSILMGCQHRETPLFASVMGVECKALLDCHGTDGEQWTICDLKTTQDASPRGFARSVADMHYDLQVAWYSAILAKHEQIETPPFWTWIAVEKKAPFVNVVYTADQWHESGLRKLEIVLDRYKECSASGKWPMPYQGIHQLEKPSWA